MNYSEETAFFSCGGERLFGVVAKPHVPAEVGVVIIVGGPQYRAGSHRQFVQLSRAFADAGYAVLRFDYRGMGDSEGQLKAFESVGIDVAAAIDALYLSVPSMKKTVLWGLCDGASAALLYMHETRDPRVSGLCLLNPWARSEASLAKTHVKHYYVQRVLQREFWAKVISGKTGWGALHGFARNVRTALKRQTRTTDTSALPFQVRMASAWKEFNRPIHLLLSENDFTAKEFIEHINASAAWTGALNLPLVSQSTIAGADHTFSNKAWQTTAKDMTLDWLNETQT